MRVKLSPWIAASGRPDPASNSVTTEWMLGSDPARLLPGKIVAVLTAMPREGCQASQVSAEFAVPGCFDRQALDLAHAAIAMGRAQSLDQRERIERGGDGVGVDQAHAAQMSFIRRTAS